MCMSNRYLGVVNECPIQVEDNHSGGLSAADSQDDPTSVVETKELDCLAGSIAGPLDQDILCEPCSPLNTDESNKFTCEKVHDYVCITA